MKIYDHGYTHAGIFHADDIFSTALLRIVNPSFKVERVNKLPDNLSDDIIVYDIGGGEFDHHQPDSPVRANNVPYAAFGLLWREFGHYILENDEDWADFDCNFVQEIDYADNTGNRTLFTKTFSDFNADPCDNHAQDAMFEQAVQFATVVLQNRFAIMINARKDMEECERLMNECDGHILLMEDRCLASWKRMCADSSYIFAIYKSPRNCWNVQGVPMCAGSNAVKIPFPEEWLGLSGDELIAASGIDGMEFCHKGGFLCAVRDKETAMGVADIMISEFLYMV